LRITFLLTQSLESPSGLGRYWPLGRELVRLGHEVTILALHHNFRSLGRRRFAKDGVKIYYVGQMHVRKTGSGKFYFNPVHLLWVAMRASWRLTGVALRTPTDVYHLGKPHPMNGLAALLLHRMRKPIYLDCDDYEAASNRFSGNWQREVVAFFEDRLPNIAAGVTVNTRFTAERLGSLGYPGNRIVYVPNGADRDRFSDVSNVEVEALRQRLRLRGRNTVLYVGSMSLTSHAVDLLLEAFAVVRQAERQAILLLVGGGEDYRALQSHAATLGLSESVHFIGRVSPAEVPLYCHLADVLVDPVRDDLVARARFPLKVVESFVTGTPVVTGDVGDRRVLLGDGERGMLVPPGDSQALAEGLLAILQDSNARARMAQAALACRERWYWDRLVRDFVQVYAMT
jgi:glycosyltransferase involved in cell wall biosynthesis